MKDILDFVLGKLRDGAAKRKLRNFEDAQFLLSLDQKDTVPFPVACAVVLCDIALVDGTFDASEYHFLFAKLEEELGVERAEAEEIVKQARAILGSGRGSSGYALFIKKTFSIEQREQILGMAEGMVVADGVTDGFERYLADRLKISLGLGN